MTESITPYRDVSLSVDDRVRDLLGRMSVEEKIGQLCKIGAFRKGDSYRIETDGLVFDESFLEKLQCMKPGTLYGFFRADWWTARGWGTAIEPGMMAECANRVQKTALEYSRLKIPLLLAEEAPHGLMALGCTVFPTGLGMGSTWNPELLQEAWAVIGAEAAAAGVHTCFGPVLDLARDPRWSRVEEDFSEDPWLTAILGKACVLGLQGGRIPLYGRPFSTLKHFAAHGDPEGGHNAAPAHVGPVELRNIQLKPFESCVKAGALALMSAYNVIDGIPCAANPVLLMDILRGEWGFKGIVMADGGGVLRLKHQRFGEDPGEIAAKVIRAGLDNSSVGCSSFFAEDLRQALERGRIGMADVDRAVTRTLSIKFRLGLFERPYLPSANPAKVIGSAPHRAVALEVARQSLVLLENKNNTLPLTGIRRIAVIGPNADTPMNQLGDYTAPQRRSDVVTVLDGMNAVAARHGAKITHAHGCKVRSPDRSGFDHALQIALSADAIVLVLGGCSAQDNGTGFLDNGAADLGTIQEYSESDKDSGEGYDRAGLRPGGLQTELLQALHRIGKPIICVLILGRPLILTEIVACSDAVLLAWYPGMAGGQAVAEAIFGELNPSGRLPVSFPRSEAQLPVYYNTHLPRQDYIDMQGTPAYAFGYGLSYTTFSYSELRLDTPVLRTDETLTVSIRVKNTGPLIGDEVVQLYLTDVSASIARPYRELRAFRRLTLTPGEEKQIRFMLCKEELGIYDSKQEFVVEPGRFTVAIGGSLDHLLEADFCLEPSANKNDNLTFE